jgi:platelet-activating factor acetylhydrolase
MSLFSLLNPANIIPRFPPYPGPYAVGSFEVEIPVASLGAMTGVAETVQFRVFYPAEKPAERPISAQPASSWWGSKCDKKTATAAVDPAAQEEKLSEPVNPATGGAKPVRWLPEPHQREYLSAYARFLGASSGFAEIVS